MATENIIMAMVKSGASRQECHEIIRVFVRCGRKSSQRRRWRESFIGTAGSDEYFKPIWGELETLTDERTFIGRASEQVERFVGEEVNGLVNIRLLMASFLL